MRVWREFWEVLFAYDPQLRLPNKYAPKPDPPSPELYQHEGYVSLASADESQRERKDDEVKYCSASLIYHHGGPPCLLQFQGTVAERHEENKRIVASESEASFRAQLFLASQLGQAMNTEIHPYRSVLQVISTVVHQLHGLDVFWDGEVSRTETL